MGIRSLGSVVTCDVCSIVVTIPASAADDDHDKARWRLHARGWAFGGGAECPTCCLADDKLLGPDECPSAGRVDGPRHKSAVRESARLLAGEGLNQ